MPPVFFVPEAYLPADDFFGKNNICLQQKPTLPHYYGERVQKAQRKEIDFTLISAYTERKNTMKKTTFKRTVALALGVISIATISAAASASDYISLSRAKRIALDHAGISSSGVSYTKAQLDKTDRVYDLEFTKNDASYDFEIDAYTGDVEDYSFKAKNYGVYDITVEEAKTAALKHAGLSAKNVTFTEAEKDDDHDGTYEISFYSGKAQYDYVIDGRTGAVLALEFDKDGRDDTATPPTPSYDNLYTLDQAKTAALKHAGVSAKNATFTKAKADWDDGRLLWELEFHFDGVEYEYDIDMSTCAIVDYDWEGVRNDQDKKPSGNKPSSAITADQAKAIAFKHAGVSSSSVKDLEVSLDRDDGVTRYEIEFKHGNYEYDYEISQSGSILKSDKEYDD